MSKIGKNPVVLPEGVSAAINGDEITLKGKLGEQKVKINPAVVVEIKDGAVSVRPKSMEDKFGLVMWGTQRSLINNAAQGVAKGFEKSLELKGVGYKAALKGSTLDLTLGFSHNVEYKLPAGVKAEIISPTEIKLTSADKVLLGMTASEIRAWREPEPYKGKGVLYKGERIRRKEGKKK